MTPKKHRLTVTVDPALVEAGQRAVESGQAESVSGWVSAALEAKIQRDRKLALLAAAVADYENEFGEISAEEITAQRRADRQDATVVRGRRREATSKAKSA
jgi:Arc/MetJ-type ribon-helix-helix transcriptional regulator